MAGGALATKRLELLREIMPHLSRVAAIWNPSAGAPVARGDLRDTEAAARMLGLQLVAVEAQGLHGVTPFSWTGRGLNTLAEIVVSFRTPPG